jgi:signal transduction histidine kinase
MKLGKNNLEKLLVSSNHQKRKNTNTFYKKIKYFVFLQIKILLLLASFSLFPQEDDFDKNIDSLAVLLKEDKKTKQPYLPEKKFLLAEKIKGNSSLKSTYSSSDSSIFLNKDLANLSLIKRKLHTFYIKTKDSSALAKLYYYKGLILKNQFKPDSAFYYYNKSKNISTQLKDSLEATKRLLSMATIQYDERDYLGSGNLIMEGLRYGELLEEVFYTGLLYERLGNALFMSERQKEARKKDLENFELKKSSPSINMKYQKARLYNNLASTYESEGNFIKAIEYFKKSLAIDNIKLKSVCRYEIALAGVSFNNFMLGNNKLAIKGYIEVLKSRQDRKDERGLVVAHSLLGEIYASNNEIKKAIFHSKKGLEKAKEIQYNQHTLGNLLLLSKLVKGEKGRQLLKEHFILNDSLYRRERSLKNQFANVVYKTEKKYMENVRLKLETSGRKFELKTEKNNKIIGSLIVGVSLLVIGFGVNIISNRKKKMLFDAQLRQVEVREKERQQIAKSLHDEVAGDIRMLHLKLEKSNQLEEARYLNIINENVRNLSHQLSSVSFNEVSFKDQIINLIAEYFEINFRIKVEEIDRIEWKTINNSIKRTLFLTIRESIQNAKKYAEASVLILSFNETKKTIVLIISDDGKGFDVNARKKGIGLKNLKERVEEINGSFSIESEMDKGMKITIEISKNGD